MPARRWTVHPDHSIYTEAYGEVSVVSREKLVEAIMDGESMLHRTGGILTVVVGRQPTDFPGEAVTTSAVVEWKDRAQVREDPERRVDVLPQREEVERIMEEAGYNSTDEELLEESRMAGVMAGKPAVIEDEHGEPEEDVSSIPPEKR